MDGVKDHDAEDYISLLKKSVEAAAQKAKQAVQVASDKVHRS